MIIPYILIAILSIALICLLVQWKRNRNSVLQIKRQYETLVDEYIALVQIDVKADCYEVLKSNPKIDMLLQETNEQANFQLKVVMNSLILKGSADELLEFVELETVLERLASKNRIVYDFQGRVNGWCRAQFVWLDKEKDIVLFSVKQIEEEKSRENQLRFLSENDLLTGLHNEIYGVQLIKKQIENEAKGMLVLIEVEGFKEINEQYGSQVGDAVIVAVAGGLKECFKEQDVLLRRGGARFAVFTNEVQDKQDGRFIMKMLVNQIEEIKIEDIRLNISAGVAFYRTEEGIQYEQLLERAESCVMTSRAISGVSVSYFD